MSKPILRITNMTKRFPGVVALDNVNMELAENEILAIVGENGAGKSTLMKILSGNYTDYVGDIFFGDKKVSFSSTKDSEAAGIAMIYQELNLVLDLTVAENIFLGTQPLKALGLVNWKLMYKEAKAILDKLGLEIDPTISVRELNASMQQLVSIARALVRKPKVLILDEPTAALTEEETNKLMAIVYDLKAEGLSCIYISHKLDEVFNISDRVVAMRDGKTVSVYTKEEIVPAQVIEDMVGRRMDQMYPESDRVMSEEILQVENLQVSHPYATNKNIIEDVSFSVRKGEILGLAGLVGSGRSELLRAIFGALPKQKGQVFIGGKKVQINSPADGIKSGIGFLTEERKKDGFIGPMNIKENMTLMILKELCRFGVIRKSREKEVAKEYFDYLRVKAPSMDSGIDTLSGGNQQKVILAKSLLADLSILFLDEPTRGIDIGAKAEIYKIMEEIAKEGMAIVMISSELPELLAMCDRFIVIGKGKVVDEFTKKEASEQRIIQSASQVGGYTHTTDLGSND